MIASTATEQQIRHYTEGYCPQLASAIWEAVSWRWQEGWSLAILTLDGGESGHLLIRIPSGEYLDVRGLWSADELRAAHPDAQLLDVEADWLYERCWDLRHTYHDLDTTRKLVDGLGGFGIDEVDGWYLAERAAL